MQDALEKLAELIQRANVQNASPGSWACILPSGEATYAGHKFPSIAEMLEAVRELAGDTGEPERVYKSAGGFPIEVLETCCAVPGGTAWDCQWATGSATYCRCKCHRLGRGRGLTRNNS